MKSELRKPDLLESEEGHALAWGGGTIVTILLVVLLLILIF